MLPLAVGVDALQAASVDQSRPGDFLPEKWIVAESRPLARPEPVTAAICMDLQGLRA